MQGLHWVLEYYYRGVASWIWFYPYYYAPMVGNPRRYMCSAIDCACWCIMRPCARQGGLQSLCATQDSNALLPVTCVFDCEKGLCKGGIILH